MKSLPRAGIEARPQGWISQLKTNIRRGSLQMLPYRTRGLRGCSPASVTYPPYATSLPGAIGLRVTIVEGDQEDPQTCGLLLFVLVQIGGTLAELDDLIGCAEQGHHIGRRRARNDISLGDALAGAMEVRAVVSPAEAAELVRSNGYKTNARNFAMMVSNTLAKDKRFKRISRGQYERVA